MAKAPSRASGSLTITFGLVSVPVKVYGGIEDSSIKRNRFSPEGNPITMLNVDSKTGEKVEFRDLVLAYPLDEDTRVELTDDEIAQAVDASNGEAEVVSFIPNARLCEYHQENLMQVRPENGKKGSTPAQKAFVLLTTAMAERDVFALVRYCLRGKPRVGALTSDGFLRQLAYTDEIRDVLPFPESELNDAELTMAGTLIDALTSDSKIDLEDDSAVAVRKYAETKAKTGTKLQSEVAETPETTDVMAALEASLKAVSVS